MKTFTKNNTVNSIARITGYVGNLSQSTTVTSVTSCYLRPMNEIESSQNGYQYGLAFMGIFEVSDNVLPQDKITIDSIQYLVKGVVKHDRGFATQYLKAVLIKPEN